MRSWLGRANAPTFVRTISTAPNNEMIAQAQMIGTTGLSSIKAQATALIISAVTSANESKAYRLAVLRKRTVLSA